jgi:hypothetical protein
MSQSRWTFGTSTLRRIVEHEGPILSPFEIFGDCTQTHLDQNRSWLVPRFQDAASGILIITIQSGSQIVRVEHVQNEGGQAVIGNVSSHMTEVESIVAAQPRESNSGLIVMPEAFAIAHRVGITSLANRYRLPAIYPYRFFTELGGLLSYGNNLTDNFRRAASYADRILKGEKPG